MARLGSDDSDGASTHLGVDLASGGTCEKVVQIHTTDRILRVHAIRVQATLVSSGRVQQLFNHADGLCSHKRFPGAISHRDAT